MFENLCTDKEKKQLRLNFQNPIFFEYSQKG